MMGNVTLLVIEDNNRLIGFRDRPAWYIPEAVEYLKNATTGHHVIAGKKTAGIIGFSRDSTLIVLSRENGKAGFGRSACSAEEALAQCGSDEEIFIAGGQEPYQYFWNEARFIRAVEINARFASEINSSSGAKNAVHFPELQFNEWRLRRKRDFMWKEMISGAMMPCVSVIYERLGRA